MNFISTILTENLINALGWTLIHSLWQGAAAAIGFALLMIVMRKYRSQTRYYVGVMTVMLVLGMAVVTFVGIYNAGAAGVASQSPGAAAMITGTVEMEGSGSIPAFFKQYFNRHLPLLVTVWMLGILVLILRFAGGFIYNQRVKVHNTHPLSKNWQARLKNISHGLGIQKSVQLVESALVKIPMTIGHFKPVILFPLGLAVGLPQDQVEALLAHELAHISRRDYLVNIMQNLIDILFFYHPGVRWISSHVRAERENCCDDIAVSVSGEPLNFARALTNIQVTRHGLNTIEPAVAASGKRHGLLARVKRLVSPPAMGSRFAEGFIGASILAVCLLTLVVSANAASAVNRDMADGGKTTAVESKTADEEKIKAKEEAEKKRKLEELWRDLEVEKAELKKQEVQLIKMEDKLRKQKKKTTKEQEQKMQQLKEDMEKRKYKMQKMEQLLALQKEGIMAEKEFRVKREKEKLEQMTLKFKNEMKVLKLKQEELKIIEEKMRKKGKEFSEDEKAKFKQMEMELKKHELELKKKGAQFRMEIERMRAREGEMRAQERAMRAQERETRAQKREQFRAQERQHREQERQLRTEERQKRKQEEQLVKQKLEKMRDEMKKRTVITKELEKKLQAAIEKKIEEKKIAKLKKELENQNGLLKETEELYKRYIVKLKEKQKTLEKKRVIIKTFETQLVRDKLVDKEGDFEFKLGKKGLYINGVKQPKKVFKKYKEIYKKLTGKDLSDSGFQIVLNGRV